MTQVNDDRNVSQFYKILNEVSTSINGKNPIWDDYVNDVKLTKSGKKASFDVDEVVHCVESSGTKNNVTKDDIIIKKDDSRVEESTFLCEICADSKPKKESFTIKGCSHSYCSECIKKYVASKLQGGVSRVSCPVPKCNGVLEPEYCRAILPVKVFERWGNLLRILVSQKFQKLKEDSRFKKFAKTKAWQRCPGCQYYVERSSGCWYMRCRCGIAFCYSCGASRRSGEANHHCKIEPLSYYDRIRRWIVKARN